MGGNVFKETNIRLPKNDALEIGQKNIDLLNKHQFAAKIIPSYRQKQEYGDIDILVNDVDCFPIITQSNIWKSTPVRNGNICSFAYPVNEKDTFQVDLISVDKISYNFAYNYFSWNDLGNFIGRFAHKMGLKFGHDGLSLPIRDGDTYISTISLTRNFDEALDFLNFDPQRFQQGFNTLEDIFEYVASNPNYYGDIFNLQHMSHNARVRDKKRKTYQQFMKWIDEHPEKDKSFRFNPNKESYKELIFENFPDASLQYNGILEYYNEQKIVKSKFNGEIVRNILNIEGKELGNFIQFIKNEYGVTFDYVIINSSATEIEMLIKKFFIYFENDKWFRLIRSEPKYIEQCAIVHRFPETYKVLLVMDHPTLLEYFPWNTFDTRYQEAIFEKYFQKYPQYFIAYM